MGYTGITPGKHGSHPLHEDEAAPSSGLGNANIRFMPCPEGMIWKKLVLIGNVVLGQLDPPKCTKLAAAP